MTYLYYKTSTWTNNPQINDETIKQWEHLADKENWRITQLPNGYYQTEVSDPKTKKILLMSLVERQLKVQKPLLMVVSSILSVN